MATLYEITSQDPSQFLSMTSYTLPEFEALLPSFEEALLNTKKTLEGQERKRKYTHYSTSPLPSSADQLFFILVYQNAYPHQSNEGTLSGLSQPTANMLMHFLSQILQSALARQGEVPARSMEGLPVEQATQAFVHDGPERPIRRPKEEEQQMAFYIGKKKAIP